MVVSALPARLQGASEVGPIQSTKVYWLVFDIKNNIARDHEFRLTNRSLGLLSLNLYMVHQNGERVSYERNYAMLAPGNQLARVSPFLQHDPPTETQYLILPLRRDETAKIYVRVNPDQRFLPPQFNFLGIADHAKYLELRRYGLYVEGALAGALLALSVFGWYSFFRNRDETSLM